MAELKPLPCPCCGCKTIYAADVLKAPYSSNYKIASVRCGRCNLNIERKNLKTAIDAWNKRS